MFEDLSLDIKVFMAFVDALNERYSLEAIRDISNSFEKKINTLENWPSENAIREAKKYQMKVKMLECIRAIMEIRLEQVEYNKKYIHGPSGKEIIFPY